MYELQDEEYDEDDEEGTVINFKPSFVLIIIDTHPSMFITKDCEENGKTHAFKDALTACYEIADSLIFSSSKSNYNQFGIVLANDDDTKCNLIDIQSNLLETVKFLKEECKKSIEDLKVQYERSTDLDLASLFLVSKKKFREINAAYYKRTIIFITNDDDPIKGDAQKKFTAFNEVKTFESCDITLELLTMNSDFNYSTFFNELFYNYSQQAGTENICEDKDGLVAKLTNSIVYRYTKFKNKFFPFKNDFTRFLGVMRVNFIREAKMYCNGRASADGKLLMKVKEDPGVDNIQFISYKLKAANSNIQFDLQEKHDMDLSELPLGFHLLYISNRQTNIGECIGKVSLLLLDPKEELGKYFEQFWQYCANNNKVLICLKKHRQPCETRYVELIPKFANNHKLFIIKSIPFSEEIFVPMELLKEPTVDELQEPSQEEKETINELINSLQHDYDPKMFINPSYGKRIAYIKSKLLDEIQEDIIDSTANCEEAINDQIKTVVMKIEKVFGIHGMPHGEKRKAPKKAAPAKRNKAKAK